MTKIFVVEDLFQPHQTLIYGMRYLFLLSYRIEITLNDIIFSLIADFTQVYHLMESGFKI